MARIGRTLRDLGRGGLFLAALGAQLRDPIGAGPARDAVRRRLARREADFLALVNRDVFRCPRSPYRRLFRHAGCGFEDLADLVRREGVEGALSRPFAAGVYLTVAETKGLRPVIRGTTSFPLTLEDLRTPLWSAPHPVSGRHVPRRRAMLADLAVNAAVTLDARGGTGWHLAQWTRNPNATSLTWVVRHHGPGYGLARWFMRVDPATTPARLEARLPAVLRLVSVYAGRPLPRVEFVPLADPTPIVTWMRDVRRAGGIPHLATATSAAVQVCETARRAGVELAGAQFGISADPITEARLAAIRQVGADALPSYGAVEAGLMAHGCLNPARPDDMHVYDDVHAMIQPGPPVPPPETLLVSSLRASAPYVLLNVSLGDQGVLERRACRCALEGIGWHTHVHTVRSFEKLKLVGAILLTDWIVRLLEEVLPRRFGGGSTDYQLVEDEAVIIDGAPRVRLLIHPRAGPVPEDAVAEAFLSSARAIGFPVDQLWRHPRWLVVERRPPYESEHGKIYHAHRPSVVVPGRG